MNIFITGTDTNIGKTVTSTIFALKYGYRYWKPLQCGGLEFSDSDWAGQYIGHDKIQREAYRLRDALSPHLAAKNEGLKLSVKYLKEQFPEERTIIEGAGGLLVPISEDQFLVDCIPKNNCKIILVARSSLGTINHTLLSIEALRSRNLELGGVVMVGDENKDNKQSIEFYGKTNVVAEIPFIKKISLEKLIQLSHNIKLEF